ncbi:hypothetical protein F5Y18DRAFT_429742 [Xylariaceae sp. FL1019]|nr:hypothetical protein F5Y18DRAFT_429742 [Xylariaceae sp. FL1019]
MRLLQFRLRHIPALIAGTTMIFGGMWPMIDPRGAMRDFGFSSHIADSPEAAPVMITGSVRTTVLGMLVLLFYSRGQMDVVDTLLAVTGTYAGLVDSFIVWREGNLGHAVFRLFNSGFISAWGIMGWTEGSND